MDRKIVTLTAPEMMQAALCGCMRRISSIYNGRKDGLIARGRDWDTEINGAAAEMAFAKVSGQYYSASVNSFKAPDIGAWQVRSTVHRNGHLLLRDDDDLQAHYVLVICMAPVFHIAGHFPGQQAAVEKYLANPNGDGECWMVPQGDLMQFDAPQGKMDLPPGSRPITDFFRRMGC